MLGAPNLVARFICFTPNTSDYSGGYEGCREKQIEKKDLKK